MSSVMSLPPIGSDFRPTSMPPAKTETLVTPAAELDQRHAQLALLLAQAGLARRDRRGDDRFDAEMGGSDAQIEILAPATDRRR